MWKLLLLIVATAAASGPEGEPDCRLLMDRECDVSGDPGDIPSTAEELEEFCNFAVPFFECANRILDNCTDPRTEKSHYREIRRIVNRVCVSDPLLKLALAESLPCFTNNEYNFYSSCAAMAEEGKGSISEILASRGITDIVEAPDAEPANCLDALYNVGCMAANVGMTCGDTSRQVLLEILMEFDSMFSKCRSGIKELLPEIVETYQAELEKEVAVQNKIKKRK